MAEQRTLNPQVLGSTPRGRTTKSLVRALVRFEEVFNQVGPVANEATLNTG
jgi:hypothetical protein